MKRMGVNLIPMARRDAKRRRGRIRLWVGVSTLFGSLWVTAFIVAQVFLASDDRKLRDEYDRTSGEMDEARAVVAALREEITVVQSRLDAQQAVGRQPDWSALLALLSADIGDRAVLRSVRLRAPHEATSGLAPQDSNAIVRLELTGFAQTQRAVSEFVLRLEEAPLFEKVTLIDTRREPFRSGSAVGFRIECELDAGGEV